MSDVLRYIKVENKLDLTNYSTRVLLATIEMHLFCISPSFFENYFTLKIYLQLVSFQNKNACAML